MVHKTPSHVCLLSESQCKTPVSAVCRPAGDEHLRSFVGGNDNGNLLCALNYPRLRTRGSADVASVLLSPGVGQFRCRVRGHVSYPAPCAGRHQLQCPVVQPFCRTACVLFGVGIVRTGRYIPRRFFVCNVVVCVSCTVAQCCAEQCCAALCCTYLCCCVGVVAPCFVALCLMFTCTTEYVQKYLCRHCTKMCQSFARKKFQSRMNGPSEAWLAI